MTPQDALAFVGDPPLWRPAADDIDEVHVSVTFTWDRAEGYRLAAAWGLHYAVVKIGGPAIGGHVGEFVPGRYLRKGVTITTRGCDSRCEHCLVPKREGRFRQIAIQPGNVIQDNNILACETYHWRAVCEMLEKQHGIEFTGGLEARRLDDMHIKWFGAHRRRIRHLFFAYDRPSQLRHVRRAVKILSACGFRRRQLRCYVLVGHPNDTIEHAADRLEETWEAGTLPFAMRWRGEDGRRRIETDWYRLCNKWMRPAATFASHNVADREDAMLVKATEARRAYLELGLPGMEHE